MADRTLDGMRVLVIEADAQAADRLARALDADGASVEVARDARSAIARLGARAADAVVLAAPLPDADWIGVAALAKKGPEPPALILLDGAGLAPALGRALPAERGADAVLERGAKPEAVAEALRAALARPGSGAVAGDASLPELLVGLHARGESGVLEIRAEGVCTRIALRAGAPVFAEGGALRETLGRILLRRGALSEADYVRVIERMTERLIESETTRMGEVLVELGLLTPAEVFEALSAQVREKIVGCFRWQRFAWSFEPRESIADELLAYPCPPLEALLLAGLRAHFGPDRLEPLLAPHAARRPVLAAGVTELAARFQLAPAEQRFAHALDGSRTLAAVRAAAGFDAVHAAQLLAALVLGRAVRWQEAGDAAPARRSLAPERPAVQAAPASSPLAPPPSAAQHTPARSSHASSSPAAEPTAARSPLAPSAPAAERAAGRPAGAPPRVAASSARVETVAADAAAATRSLAKLRARLSQSGRSPLDPRAAALEAERAFRQGLNLLEQSALPGALRAFGRACALQGDEPEYRMYEAWTELLAARDDAARALARAKAGACAERVLARDADSVRAHAILGQLAAAGGELDAAERHFRAALRSAPEDRDALRGLRLLERRRAPR